MRVIWDDDALNDLDSVGEYIARDNPFAARRVIERIREVSLLLETSPHLGRPRADRPDARELTISRYPYILVYEVVVEIDEVRILAVFHQAQDR